MAAKYRIGVIGHTNRGNYGHGLDRVWADVPECQLVGVADPEPKGLAQAVNRLGSPKGFQDYRQMLDETKPDIVSVAMRWIDRHHEVVLAAAERGIHVYLEKPMCRTPAEADAIVEACERMNVKLAIAFQTRYSPRLHLVKQLLDDGEIGQVLEFRGRGKEDRRGGGEDLWVLGSHIMNLITYLGGDPAWCFGSVLHEDRPITAADVHEGNEGIGPLAGSAVNAMYGMDNRATAYFATHRDAAGGRFGLQVCGSKGVIELTTGFLPAVHLLKDPSWSPGRSGQAWVAVSSAGIGKPEPISDGSHHVGNVTACRDLIDAIEQDRLPEANMYEARMTVEMIAAPFESQRQGKPVKFPLESRANPLALLARG